MYSFTVYQSKTSKTFRVVAGDHEAPQEVERYTARVYQGADRQAAIDAAYAGEESAEIREQIKRFGVTAAKTLKKLPPIAAHYLPGRKHDNKAKILIKRGESGYYMFEANMTVERFNEINNVTNEQANAMLHGSMFGWEVPAADPDNEANKGSLACA